MLQNYDKRHRPIENQSAPIKVSVSAIRRIIFTIYKVMTKYEKVS